MNCFAYILSPHVGKPLYGFGKTLDGFVRISMFKTIPDTVLDVTLQHYLSTAVKGGFCGVDLSQNILAGDILVHHPVNSLNLPDNFFQAAVQVFGIHTLSHINHLHTVKGIYFYMMSQRQAREGLPAALRQRNRLCRFRLRRNDMRGPLPWQRLPPDGGRKRLCRLHPRM